MTKTSKFAAAFGFSAEAETDDDKKEKEKAKAKPARMDGETDEAYAKRCEEAEKNDKEAAGKKAEGKEDEEKKDDEVKAQARAEGFAQGQLAERGRWATVLSASEAAGRGINACVMLETTDMSAAAICSVLTTITIPDAKTAAPGAGLYARMAAADLPKPTPGAEPAAVTGELNGVAAAIVAAAAKARGEAPKTKAAA